MLKATPFRKVDDMTTDTVGATVIDLQSHSARRRARFEEAMKRHPAYLSRIAASGEDAADIGRTAPVSTFTARRRQPLLQPL
ncbi:hypothetical protein [Mycolicibacterium vaccae]|uniref:hypothetical protein n=1 Tax=Mycolicibacterium vaccae TaxID=1810 RepID=UPI003CFB203E